jgi:hypothetical protein
MASASSDEETSHKIIQKWRDNAIRGDDVKENDIPKLAAFITEIYTMMGREQGVDNMVGKLSAINGNLQRIKFKMADDPEFSEHVKQPIIENINYKIEMIRKLYIQLNALLPPKPPKSKSNESFFSFSKMFPFFNSSKGYTQAELDDKDLGGSKRRKSNKSMNKKKSKKIRRIRRIRRTRKSRV